MKRNPLSTIAELLFPIIIIFAVWGIRQGFKVKKYYFSSTEKSDSNFTLSRSIANVDTSSLLSTDWNGQTSAYGYIFDICYISAIKNRTIIASVNVPDDLKKKIYETVIASTPSVFEDFLNANTDVSKLFKDFDSEEDLNEYIDNLC